MTRCATGVFSCRMDYHGDWRCRLVPCAREYAFLLHFFRLIPLRCKSSVIRGAVSPAEIKNHWEFPGKVCKMFLQKAIMRNCEKKRDLLKEVITQKSTGWEKMVCFLMLFAGSITLLANTCAECDTTFWPREGENGRLCRKCENKERERRQIENDDAMFEMNSKRYTGWIFFSEGSNRKYQIMLRSEQNPRERVWGKYGLLSLNEKRQQCITNRWFKEDSFEPVFFPRIKPNA